MKERLFRAAAIEKVSSPEQLDLAMRVTSPAGWLSLLIGIVVLLIAGGWTLVGSVPDLVDGQGTLFRGERLAEIKATMPGTLVALNVKPGSAVKAGQVIGVIRRQEAGIEERLASQATLEKNRAMIERKRAELATVERQREGQQRLVNEGIVARFDMIRFDREILDVRGQIDGLERENRVLQAKMDVRAELTAAESGRVTEVIKSLNDRVSQDETLLRIEPEIRPGEGFCGGQLHAIVYLPAITAPRIKPGQAARILPAGVKKEEYGFIRGRVEWVAARPTSTEDMTEKLKNDQLVRSFTATGPVIEARVCLAFDPANAANSFQWSSSRGPAMAIDAGATCAASVVVEERRPVTYLIPAIRRATGL